MPSIQFKGKSIVQTLHLTVPYRSLEPVPGASLTEKVRLDDNLIIHGDNLHALKALLPSYSGRVKCIYIDPPYNTGNENWVYNDNVNSPMHQEWLRRVVDRDDLTRHDKWLCMMWPRLMLLKELLSDDGAIFISIDDNEVHRLRLVMDEIFGEENFRNCIIAPRGTKNVQAQFDEIDALATGHDYLLVYSKNPSVKLQKLQTSLAEDEPGKWDTFWRGTDRSTMRYQIFGQEPSSGQWRWQEKRARKAVANYKAYLEVADKFAGIDEYYITHRLNTGNKLDFVRLSDDGSVQYYVPPRSHKIVSDVWMDLSFTGNHTEFVTEKPLSLLERLIRWATQEEDVILDSFAGSGTTGHAVLALNAADGWNRRFILIEQEEYADSLTAERVRRVIQGVAGARDEALEAGLGGSFSFFRLGEPLDEEALLSGERLPSYVELARYAFFTATGEQLDESRLDEGRYYLGQSRQYDEIYLIYQPDVDFLKNTPLTLSWAESLGAPDGKKRLVLASHKYLDDHKLRELKIEYSQLPFAIYRFRG